MGIRLAALIIKELLSLLRDPKGRAIVVAPPMLQLIVFAFAATMEVRNVDLVYLNRDSGVWSQEMLFRLEGAETFRSIRPVHAVRELEEEVTMRRATAALHWGPTFSRDIEAGRPATMQIILDGRKSNSSQIVGGYLADIVRQLNEELAVHQRTPTPAVQVIPRNWFNPNLIYQWFMVPSLVGTIALLIGLVVTALSIARERELGTFDQLMVSPLRTHEILLGKLIPPILIGLFHITLFIAAAVFVFGIPLRGSLGMLLACAIVYMASLVGLGLWISTIAMTQQQAILGAFLLLVPAILLSGFATPIENMPEWLQTLTLINPLRYFLVVVKGVFLKDPPAALVVRNMIPLMAIAVVTLTAAAWQFRRRIE